VSVRDTGVGISADMLPRVFDMFTQAERSRQRAQGGLGIGLTLVRKLVELHGGSVRADSAGDASGRSGLEGSRRRSAGQRRCTRNSALAYARTIGPHAARREARRACAPRSDRFPVLPEPAGASAPLE